MQLFGAIRQRAKWIESQADALIGEHGKNAYTVACYMERQANSLSTKIFWQAIKKVVVARPLEDEIELLPPPKQANNCISCLVEKISGTHESGGPPTLRACASCLTRRIDHSH